MDHCAGAPKARRDHRFDRAPITGMHNVRLNFANDSPQLSELKMRSLPFPKVEQSPAGWQTPGVRAQPAKGTDAMFESRDIHVLDEVQHAILQASVAERVHH